MRLGMGGSRAVGKEPAPKARKSTTHPLGGSAARLFGTDPPRLTANPSRIRIAFT